MAGSKAGCQTMPNVDESAASCWEVDRRIGGSVMRPFCVIVLRNKKRSESYVKASSADINSMQAIAEQMQKDLYSLSNDDFVAKYTLGSCS